MPDTLTILRQAFSALGTQDPRAVAYHEAAHVVVGEHLGKTLVEVWLDDTPGRPGAAEMEWRGELSPQERRARDAVICMAGACMDKLLVGKFDTGDTDFDQVVAVLLLLGFTKAEFPKLLPQLHSTAQTIIAQRIGEIIEIGILLLSHKRLAREELLGKSTVPLFTPAGKPS